jgi:hypothetical protein
VAVFMSVLGFSRLHSYSHPPISSPSPKIAHPNFIETGQATACLFRAMPAWPRVRVCGWGVGADVS